MSITVCSRCGASYQGWQCPNCYAADKHRETTEAASEQLAATLGRNAELQREAAERLAERIAEEQEATRRSQEEAAYRMEMATAEATRQHTHAIAHSWKLEASAKAERAYELYRAHLYPEAIALAQGALQQDPGNLSAYKTAAWSLEAQDKPQEARTLYEKQLALLGTPDYRSSAFSFASVVNGLPSDETLLGRARQVFHELVDSWALDDDTHYLLQQLCERQWATEISRLLQRLSSKPSGGRLLPHLVTLRGAGYKREAYSLAGSLARTEPTLAHYGWSIELGDNSPSDVEAFDRWLASIPASNRASLAEQATYLRKGPATALAAETVTVLREAIVRRRQAWQDDVVQQFALEALETSRRDSALEHHLATVPLVSRPIPAGFFVFCLFGILPASGISNFSDNLGCGFLLVAGVGSLALWFVLKKKAIKELYHSSYHQLWRSEEAMWHEALQA